MPVLIEFMCLSFIKSLIVLLADFFGADVLKGKALFVPKNNS